MKDKRLKLNAETQQRYNSGLVRRGGGDICVVFLLGCAEGEEGYYAGTYDFFSIPSLSLILKPQRKCMSLPWGGWKGGGEENEPR